MLNRLRALPIHQRLYLIAPAVLAAGLIAYALIVHFAPPEPDMSYPTDGADFPVPKDVNRQYQFQIERIGGQEGLLSVQFNDWFISAHSANRHLMHFSQKGRWQGVRRVA